MKLRVFLVSICLLNASFSGAVSKKLKSRTHQILIENMVFSPSDMTVHKGDVVVWTNKDLVPHTVTGPNFESGSISPASKWTYRVKPTDDFEYRCSFHSAMKGKITVIK